MHEFDVKKLKKTIQKLKALIKLQEDLYGEARPETILDLSSKEVLMRHLELEESTELAA